MVLRRILTWRGRLSHAKWSYAQNGEQPIRLWNGLLYPRVEVEQRSHSGDEIAFLSILKTYYHPWSFAAYCNFILSENQSWPNEAESMNLHCSA